jgi:broad specificity phosphatase PhoE
VSLRRLVLVRHGESVWNVERRVQGQTCRGLTGTGRDQAARTAELLAAWIGEAQVVSSDLGRCQETAAPIGAALGVEIAVDPELRERHFGRWEGLDRDGLLADDADRYARWRSGEDVIAEIGGESDSALRDRSARAFRGLLDDVADDAGTVVAVTHGGTIWYGLHELLRLDGYRLGAVHNASVTELVRGGTGPAGLDPTFPHLARFNETSHLR